MVYLKRHLHCWLQKLAPDGSAGLQEPEHSSGLALAFALQKPVLCVQEGVSQESVGQVVRLLQIDPLVLLNLFTKNQLV